MYVFEPLLVLCDVISINLKQNLVIECFERLAAIDEKLYSIGIHIDYRSVRNRTVIYALATILGQSISFVYTIFVFDLGPFRACVYIAPMIIFMLTKVWIVSFIDNLTEKFSKSTKFLESSIDLIESKKQMMLNLSEEFDHNNQIDTIYLHVDIVPQLFHRSKTHSMSYQQTLPDGKLTANIVKSIQKIVVMHEECCEVIKLLNRIFGLSIFLLMIYLFIFITLHSYFVYCNLTGQTLPIFMVWAEEALFEVVYFFSCLLTAGVCAFSIWKLKCESNNLAIKIHQVINCLDDMRAYKKVK